MVVTQPILNHAELGGKKLKEKRKEMELSERKRERQPAGGDVWRILNLKIKTKVT